MTIADNRAALAVLRDKHGADIEVSRAYEEDCVVLSRPEALRSVVGELHNSFPFLLDVCGVDYLPRVPRFEVVYHFADPEQRRRVRLKVPLVEGAELVSVTDIYRSADWFERETYDMFGIKFRGHPNLRRILCHEDFVGHPLRKDYPADKNQALTTPLQHIYEQEEERLKAERESGKQAWRSEAERESGKQAWRSEAERESGKQAWRSEAERESEAAFSNARLLARSPHSDVKGESEAEQESGKQAWRSEAEREKDHLADRVLINIGPAHPATHGTLRFMAVLSGETIEKMDIEIGYLHRCFEKMCETHDYNQIIPYTDRLNYCSAPMNNNTWCRTIEKLLGVEVPPRAQVMRVILDEFSRCIDHFVCISTNAVDLGALTNFWLGFQARERVYHLFERLCGARLTVSLARVGGMGFDLPDGWVALARDTLQAIDQSQRELDSLLTNNRIFKQRMVGTAEISQRDAINWGFTGPCLRATGVPLDLRVAEPYSGYEQFAFDIPVGERGDSYDRYAVRMAEIRQSMRIITQALDNIPSGPIAVADPAISLPARKDTYGNIEGLMNQFMLVIQGVQPPRGEVYCSSEAANGELGFYVVSDGSGKPWRVKCRPPCFAIFQAFPHMCKGQMLADAIAALGSINIIAGELDR